MPRSSDWRRILICSDLHSVFLDRKCWTIFLQVCEAYQPDQVVINGDLLDCVGISEHAKKLALNSPEVIDDFPFDYELEFTKQEILQPLRKALGKKPRILIRLGNHEMRFIRPNRANAEALGDILDTCAKRGETTLEGLLRLDSPKIDAEMSHRGIDVLFGTFTLIHGVRLSPTVSKQNLQRYGSGSSGHSHRMTFWPDIIRGEEAGWYESGCLRTTRNVEYLPHGDMPNWMNGFVDLVINRNTGKFFCHQHPIVGANTKQCWFNGELFSA